MRLLHIRHEVNGDGSLQLSLCEFLGGASERPRYAIFSHRWREEEVLFTDMTGDPTLAKSKHGYQKLEACCKVALKHGLQFVWADTCCIDKSSSADLSEAINSMYAYYAKSDLCIAYLDDIEDSAQELQQLDSNEDSYLNRAIWFTRGWTLQELIAPKDIYFYSKGWKQLGTKITMSREVSAASGVKEQILVGAALDQICVSEKMSWAAHRTTTRPEDRAYSLMGLFNVNMPPL
jgi:hypothetical protein